MIDEDGKEILEPDRPGILYARSECVAHGFLGAPDAFEAIEPFDTCVIGDVDSCRRKLRAFESTGLDRLMCLMQFGNLDPRAALRSIEVIGKHLIPEMAAKV